MELEEMKGLWNEMSKRIDNQKILTDKLVIQLTKQNYVNKLKAISIPESIGTVVCFASAVYIFMNFGKLDTWYLQLFGFFVIAYSLILPALSLRAIKKMKSIDIAGNTYKQSLMEYAKSKKHFMFIQKLSYYLGFILLLVILPVFAKLMRNTDVFHESMTWVWYAPFGMLFLYFFSMWVYKGYKKATTSAENILKELDE